MSGGSLQSGFCMYSRNCERGVRDGRVTAGSAISVLESIGI